MNQDSDWPDHCCLHDDRREDCVWCTMVNQDSDMPKVDYGKFDDQRINVGPGWWPLLAEAHERIGALWPDYEIAQVKEKFGGLRIYLSYWQQASAVVEACEAVLRDLETRSLLTCEMCGQPGVPRETGWIKTLCDSCGNGAAPSRLHSKRSGSVTVHWREPE